MSYTPVTAGGNSTPTSANPFSGMTGLGLTLNRRTLELPVTVGVSHLPWMPAAPAWVRTISNNATVNDLLTSLLNGDPDQVEKVQHSLFDAGFFPKAYYSGTKDVAFGSVDDDTVKAYTKLLLEAARSKRPVDDVLSQHEKTFQQQATQALQYRPVQIEATSPQDLRYTFDHIVRIRLGRKDDALVNDMLYKYLSLEADYQQKAQQAEGPIGHPEMATAGTFVKPPDPSAFAEAQVQQQRPTDVAAGAIGEQAKNLETILHGQ